MLTVPLPSSASGRLGSSDQLRTCELASRGREEIHQFLRGTPTANPACFELFRRAVVLHDEGAWATLYDLYSNLVGSWILHSPAARLLPLDEYASLINAAFAKFSRGVSADKFADFRSVEALLSYLKRCTRSAVLDEVRAWRARLRYEVTLEGMEEEPVLSDPAEEVVSALSSTQLWQQIASLLQGEEERILLQELVRGAKPREIQAHHWQVFATVEEVYRVQRNMRGRLRRHRQVQALLQFDEHCQNRRDT